MINKDGGRTVCSFYGGNTAVMKGEIELMGIPQSPPPPTRENPEASALSQPLTVEKVLVCAYHSRPELITSVSQRSK